MVLDGAGFPKASEIWKGNTHDNRTMEAMLEQLEQRRGTREQATVVMDRRIATAENLAKVRAHGCHYIVSLVSASRWKWVGRIPSAELTQLGSEHPGIGVGRVEDDEAYLRVRSESRREGIARYALDSPGNSPRSSPPVRSRLPPARHRWASDGFAKSMIERRGSREPSFARSTNSRSRWSRSTRRSGATLTCLTGCTSSISIGKGWIPIGYGVCT